MKKRNFSTRTWSKLEKKEVSYTETNMEKQLEEIRSKFRISKDRFALLVDDVTNVITNYNALSRVAKYNVMLQLIADEVGREAFVEMMKNHFPKECDLIANPPMDLTEFDLPKQEAEKVSKAVKSTANKVKKTLK